jgi:7,8-dihydropterin-6-yl-methyl-4-(beta-D-ribofuranosyl)aminobenzene 5'-phosphate synthase
MAANGSLMLLPAEPDFADIAAAGGEIVRAADAHLLGGGFFYGSGAIPRVTAYETGLAGHHSFRDGVLEADPLIMDERFLAARVRGRGVSVFSACSHAGIVNACLGAQGAFPDTPLDLVLGGYHLAGRIMEMRIADTVRDLERLVRPRIVAPGHCTGWRAKAALAQAFAPAHYAPSVVGSLYRLAAPA